MMTFNLNVLPCNRAVVLNNVTCPYCGVVLNIDTSTKEHVIGRRFVPKGTLDKCWNLITRACQKCNSAKSDLENDISAITLSGKIWFNLCSSDERVAKEAYRKVKNSISNKTRKPVLQSQEKLNIEFALGPGINIKCNLVSPPQVEQERLCKLAHMQLMAFFYYITFNKKTKLGGFWPGGFYPLSEAHHGDWGNSLQKSFMAAVVDWEPRWVGNTAGGFFKSIIRRHPSAECWSWALEWNQNIRVIGFFGDRYAAQMLVDEFEVPMMNTIKTGDNSYFDYRGDVKLPEEEDLLFILDS